MTSVKENVDLPVGKEKIGKSQATHKNRRQVEKSRVFYKTEKPPTEELPADLIDKIFEKDLKLDPELAMGWTQNDISRHLVRGKMPPGLTIESLKKLIEQAEVLD